MKKFVFITGGVRSGKSSYAVEMADKIGSDVSFVATAIAFDDEMKNRIDLHKQSRPEHWQLIEEPHDIDKAIANIDSQYKGSVILIDCFGVFINNLLMKDLSDDEIFEQINKIIKAIERSSLTVILVSNEVGHGIVPENELARRFRDIVGFANQICAKAADEFIFMQCGIPMKLK